MSQPGTKHPSTPDESSQSDDALEIVSIGIDESQPETPNQDSLSQDKLNQVADKINADFQKNKK